MSNNYREHCNADSNHEQEDDIDPTSYLQYSESKSNEDHLSECSDDSFKIVLTESESDHTEHENVLQNEENSDDETESFGN